MLLDFTGILKCLEVRAWSNIMKWDKICSGKGLKNFFVMWTTEPNSKFSQHLQETLNSIGPIDEITERVQVVDEGTFMNVV
jgi:hypothetical protein